MTLAFGTQMLLAASQHVQKVLILKRVFVFSRVTQYSLSFLVHYYYYYYYYYHHHHHQTLFIYAPMIATCPNRTWYVDGTMEIGNRGFGLMRQLTRRKTAELRFSTIDTNQTVYIYM